ncbi:MAG TPA: choice-of-anchor P family protein [Bryobacteraceae bacterium]|nr:choice-of-anchor P family protein [Bryobacteraceae bacterium]
MFQQRITSRMMTAAFLLAGVAVWPTTVHAQNTPTYTGEAFGASVNALGIKTTVSDTGALSSSGGSLSTQLAGIDLPGLLDLHLLTASTNGSNSVTSSQASVANISVTAVGVSITASVLTSNASAQSCAAGNPAVTGGSTIANLVVNGQPITVTGAPNQTVPLLIGSLIINEQSSAVYSNAFGSGASITVNALHLKVAGLAEVIIASSSAGVSCGSNGCSLLF